VSPGWLHEIKHDGYRLMGRRDAAGVRLLTRNGHDWSPRYPFIVAGELWQDLSCHRIKERVTMCKAIGVVVVAVVGLSTPAASAAPRSLHQERVCEGVVKKTGETTAYTVPYELGTVDKRADPVQYDVGTCWVNSNNPIANQILKVCQEEDRCRLKVYGECQLPRIVEFPKEAKNCPSGFAVQRVIEVRKLPQSQ
jgi:hypothetical protein